MHHSRVDRTIFGTKEHQYYSVGISKVFMESNVDSIALFNVAR